MALRLISIAALLRLQFLAALMIGWPMAVGRVQPRSFLLLTLAISALFGVAFWWRRKGPPRRRVIAAMVFFAGGAFIAYYSAFVAKEVQTTEPSYPPGTHAWASLDAAPGALAVIGGFPIAIVLGIMMLRAWINCIPSEDAA